MRDPTEEAKGFVDRLRDESVPWVRARTVALMIETDPGAVSQHGTGILIGIADSVFLVSAAHVLGDARTHQLWINPLTSSCPLLPLEGVEINTTENRDEVDFGFVELPPAILERLAPHKAVVRLSDVDWGVEPVRGWYAAFGYPTSVNAWNHTAGTIPTTAVYYATRLHDWKARPLEKFTPQLNIALEFAPDRSVDAGTREISVVPPLPGISGCGIWRLYTIGSSPTAWTKDHIKLAGIEHTVVRYPHAFIGIRFSHILSAIRRDRPDLAPAIDIHLPLSRSLMVVRDVD